MLRKRKYKNSSIDPKKLYWLKHFRYKKSLPQPLVVSPTNSQIAWKVLKKIQSLYGEEAVSLSLKSSTNHYQIELNLGCYPLNRDLQTLGLIRGNAGAFNRETKSKRPPPFLEAKDFHAAAE